MRGGTGAFVAPRTDVDGMAREWENCRVQAASRRTCVRSGDVRHP
jgi:hypothetical protein